ncbi:MAG: MBL fold hydrolase [Deltaproteobacteria bacterium RBG_13_47_9]|nr:MAG: MBL fold hydrolase [Deltaproteobacteria bacterium RBG_13_47_9]
MSKITEGVYMIPGQDEFIPDSHTYIIGDLSSQDLSLIDPGLVRKGDYKIQSVEKMGIELTAIKRVIMTHTHFDHIGCLSEIQKKIPGAELWVHASEAEALERGDERTVYGMDMFESLCQKQYGIRKGAFTFEVNRKLQGGETLQIGQMAWEVIHIPGHSLGSIGLYHKAKKLLVPGDVVYADYAIGRFDLYGANAAELKNSLMQLAQREVDILLPGHNDIVTTLPAGYILQTLRQWEPYLV